MPGNSLPWSPLKFTAPDSVMPWSGTSSSLLTDGWVLALVLILDFSFLLTQLMVNSFIWRYFSFVWFKRFITFIFVTKVIPFIFLLPSFHPLSPLMTLHLFLIHPSSFSLPRVLISLTIASICLMLVTSAYGQY